MTMPAKSEGISAPGVYDIPIDAYHADPRPPSMSSSGARTILNRCPAVFRYQQDNPPAPKRHFDIGHAAHRVLLGLGAELVVLDPADFPSKNGNLPDGYTNAAMRAARDDAYGAGKVPLLKAEFEQVQAMAQAVDDHPFAGKLFRNGVAEQSLIWQDDETGVWCRARPDYLVHEGRIFPDYKTCQSAKPDDLRKSLWNFGYHQQCAWYQDGIRALGIHDNPAMAFVFQEKEPPYIVTVAIPDAYAREWAHMQNRKARDLFSQCLKSGEWPAYADDVVTLELPGYAESQLQQKHEAGAFELSMAYHKPLDAAE